MAGGTWAKANDSIRQALDKRCMEPFSLFLFQNQVLRSTYNHPKATNNIPHFSQGQCCLVAIVPSEENDRLWVRLVPLGKYDFDPAHLPPGWDMFALQPSPTPIFMVSFGQTKARRHQYRVTYYVASTVHRAIDQTCPMIATQVSIQNHKYRLWDKQQLLVVVSRVSDLDNIVFVTQDIEDTLLAMVKLIHQIIPMNRHTENLITALALDAQTQRIVPHQFNPSLTLDLSLPDDEAGYVYMLVSCRLKSFA